MKKTPAWMKNWKKNMVKPPCSCVLRSIREARVLMARGSLGKTAHASMALTATGAVLAAQGRPGEARGEFEHALQLRRKVPGISPWPTLEIVIRLAHVLLDLGDRGGARELADDAGEVLATLPDGTHALTARLAELERRLAGQPRPAAHAEPLTEREVAVLHLLAGTLSLREIGRELYVSANTVKTHTQAIYRKLGVSTRHDAIQQARRQGFSV